MKVLFVEDVPGTAYSGDIKEVKPGFARNYLLPRKLAVLATRDQMNRVVGLQAAASKRRDATEVEMKSLSESLEGVTITIEGRAGRNDRLYGSITNVMVAEEISKVVGREIDRRRVSLDPIRQLGTYEVPVKLAQGIEPKVTVIITAPGRVGEDEVVDKTEAEVMAELEAEEAAAKLEAKAPEEPVGETAAEPEAEAPEEPVDETAAEPEAEAPEEPVGETAAEPEAEAPEGPVGETAAEPEAEAPEGPVGETVAEPDTETSHEPDASEEPEADDESSS